MIIGNGLLAKKFSDYEMDNELLIFASGVSNSSETSLKAFDREKNLLLDALNNQSGKKLIYFSTCSMYDRYFDINAYTNHKLNMESMIQKLSESYTIIRLPQVLGVNNQYQLMGFLYRAIKENKNFNLFNIERNVIDIEDVKLITSYMIKHDLFQNRIINIAHPKNIKVLDLVGLLEKILEVKSNYTVIDKIGSLDICIDEIKFIIDELDLFKGNYIEERILKYCEKTN